MHILAIIPARGGSKGIVNKNIRPFSGKPLIAHTIDVAKKSRHITRVVVSTDSKKIADVAKKCGAEVPFLRPPEFAGDSAKITDAIAHLILKMREETGYEPEVIVLLQPTSPLRTAADIDNAIDLLLARKAPAVVSVCKTEQLLFTKDRSDLLAMVSDKTFLTSSNRQELKDTYKLDGSMVYGIRTNVFLREKSFLPIGVIGYEVPRWRAVDIDEPQDFLVGELIFQNRKKIERSLRTFH
ncbi:MAG: acylneuraminate cytidylyltransferase family protein [bacterium]|nr:acylneuraminate cytidylyltransferase family protein [bacterium]